MPESTVTKAIQGMVEKYGEKLQPRIDQGVRQVARLWREEDGSPAEFEAFCLQHFIACDKERETVFFKISRYFEVLNGHFNEITLGLQEVLQLDIGDIYPIDQMFGSYSASAHVNDDFYANKIAFITVLNFPFYSLAEKRQLAPSWTRLDWAYARLGDQFNLRLPARLLQKYSEVNTRADMYISDYNIFMGQVLSEKGQKLFPAGMKLLTHWNLRDELKVNYGAANGLEKQRLIYKVMQQIISQEIPQVVINNGAVEWNPFLGKVFDQGKEIDWKSEPNTRYQNLLDNFLALKEIDAFCPEEMNTYIERKFDAEMEISQPEVEALFIRLVSSPQVKKVGRLIQKRLKRNLEPFDIWYDGFKARSGIAEEKLSAATRQKYPTPQAMKADFPNILGKLGFAPGKIDFIAGQIVVDPARGSGHAWSSDMKTVPSHLRTRVFADGMDYKGYNIAIHEFGHTVEQTISLHKVDYYMMRSVPNTSFTEALAFIFQRRDLDLLGMKETNPDKEHLEALDTFWSVYEIMGVSLLDMRVWKWLYENPGADAAQLKEAVIRIAKEIWNKYYAPVFGVKDQPLLAIYSHMISYPLYLSAYSYGHVIDFQIEQHLKGKNFGAEVERMFSCGRLIPQLWMKQAVGNEISIDPLLTAVDKALKNVK